MRHASSRFTLDVYSQARKGANRHAQQRVVQMILPERFDDAVPAISLGRCANRRRVVRILELWGCAVGMRICDGIDLKSENLGHEWSVT